MAAAAVATAQADADLRRVDRSLADQLGRTLKVAPRSTVPTCAVIGIAASVDDTLAAVDGGAATGRGDGEAEGASEPRDLATPRAVREAWPALALAVDLNGSAGLGHLDVLAALDDLGLAYLEQPLPTADLVGSAVVGERLAAPVRARRVDHDGRGRRHRRPPRRGGRRQREAGPPRRTDRSGTGAAGVRRPRPRGVLSAGCWRPASGGPRRSPSPPSQGAGCRPTSVRRTATSAPTSPKTSSSTIGARSSCPTVRASASCRTPTRLDEVTVDHVRRTR